jgi:hypothetical protein
MGQLEQIGYDDTSERELFVLEMARSTDWPQDFAPATKYFVCVVAWDARNVSGQEVASFARTLLDRGAAYVGVGPRLSGSMTSSIGSVTC